MRIIFERTIIRDKSASEQLSFVISQRLAQFQTRIFRSILGGVIRNNRFSIETSPNAGYAS
jgi:hypothetical protein